MTINDLAKILALSPSTVSRALNDSHEISTKTKLRVQSLAKELNFVPNPIASSLRSQKNKTIAIVIPDITNSFYAKAIEGIEAIAQEKGYHILIYFTFESYEKEVAILRHLANGRVDGVIISLSAATNCFEHLAELKSKKIPIVFFDRVCNEIYAPKITTDNYEAATKATKHLLDKHCKKIAFLNFSTSSLTSNKRKQGYIKAIEQANLIVDKSLILDCTTNKETNLQLISNLLMKRNDIDAVFASSESLCVATYQICESLGLDISKQIKVIGFSNMAIAQYLNPALTCITQPAFNMGKEAAQVFFKMIEKPNVDYNDVAKTLNTTMVIRKSTT